MISKEAFFSKYGIGSTKFAEAKLCWSELEEIYVDYEVYKRKLQSNALSILDTLMNGPNVHSVRYRIKDAEHLLEKIVRKRINDPSRVINLTNYKQEIDDLLGFRILHLFKTDWEAIDEYIRSEYKLKNNPIANHRQGDAQEMINIFTAKGCDAKVHPHGYRSVHYTITFSPGKVTMQAEIQVRTIFEEGWSEIDHKVRYPYKQGDLVLAAYLSLLNRTAGIADEMSTFITIMDAEFEKRNEQIAEQQKLIADLKEKVENLQVGNDQQQEKDNITREINKLEESNRRYDYLISDPIRLNYLFKTSASINEVLNGLERDRITDDISAAIFPKDELRSAIANISSLSGVLPNELKQCTFSPLAHQKSQIL